MVNALTPPGNVEYPNTDFQVESNWLVTESGYICSSADYIQLDLNQGIRLGGQNDTTNLQFFGVNDFSNNCQDVEVFVKP